MLFGFSGIGYINIYSYYIFLLDHPIYDCIFSFFVFCYFLCFKVHFFFWCEYCYPSFIFTSISWQIFLHPFIFNLFVFRSEMSPLWAAVDGSCFFNQAVILCLLIGAFSLFTFKVIIDRYVLLASFFVLVLWLFCSSLFLSSLALFSWGLKTFLVIYLDSFLLIFCLSITGF